MSLSQSDDLFTNVDDYSDTRNLQKQNAELRRMNDQLIKDNKSIKKQFQEATSIKDQMQKIHDTNAQLAMELRKARSEKEEFESRMKCNIESLEKKRAEMEEEKREIENRAQITIEDARRNFAQEKKKLTEQVDALTQKIQELEDALKTHKEEKDVLVNSCHDVLSAAQSYFVIPFKNLEQLSQHLSKLPVAKDQNELCKPNHELNNNNKNLENQTQDLQKKINSLKQKIKAERKARREIEFQNERLAQTTKDLEAKNQDLESKLSELVHKMKSLTSNDQSSFLKCSTLEEQIDRLTSSLEEQRGKARELQLIVDQQRSNGCTSSELNRLQSTLESKNSKIKTLQTTLISLKQQNTMLLSRIKENDKTKETLRSRNQNLQDENLQCTAGIQKLKDDNTKLSNENNLLKEQKETLENKLQVAQSAISQMKSALSEAQCQNDKYQNSLALLEMSLLKQKQELIDIVSERSKCINALQKQNVAMTALQDQLTQATGDLKEAQKKIISLTNDLKQNEYLPKMEEIPETSWFCIDFPKELCNRIADETREQTSTTIKLRRILSTIAKYYNSELDNLNNGIKQANQNQNEAALRITHLFSALSPMIKNSPPDYQTFISNPDSEKRLLQSISDLHDSQIDLKVQNIKLTNQMKEMAAKLHTDDVNNVSSALDQLIINYNNLLKELEAEKANEKKLKRALRSLKVNAENEKRQTQNDEKERLATIQSLQNDKKQLQSELTSLNEKVEVMQTHIKEMGKMHSDDISYYQSNLDTNNKYSKQMSDLKSEYDQQLTSKDEYVRKAAKKIEKLESEISQWKRTSELMKNAKIEKDQQYVCLVNKMEESSQEYQRLRDAYSELSEAKEQCEKIIEEIKQKNKNLKNLYEQAKASLDETKEQNKNYSSENMQLAAENQQLKSDLQTLQEEIKREKQLNDAKMKAVNLSNETQRLLDVENAKSKFDEEKRNLFEFVALSFHHLFDAREELNNETFKILIEKASTELQKYIRQDAAVRRLLGIKAYESPEEAISRLLLSMYQH